MLKPDAEVGELGIKVTVAVYLAGEPPIIVNDEGIVEQLEVSGWSHQKVAEPGWDWKCRLRFPFFVILVVRLCVEIDDVGHNAGPISVSVA